MLKNRIHLRICLFLCFFAPSFLYAKTLAELIADLRSGDSRTVAKAAEELKTMGKEAAPAAEALGEALTQSMASSRRLGQDAGVGARRQNLSDWRMAANATTDALIALGPDAGPAVPKAFQLLSKIDHASNAGDRPVSLHVLEIASKLGTIIDEVGPGAVTYLVDRSKVGGDQDRETAITMLGRIGKRHPASVITEAVSARLTDPSPMVAKAAAERLRYIGAPAVSEMPKIVAMFDNAELVGQRDDRGELLNHDDALVEAAKTLHRLAPKSPETIPALRELSGYFVTRNKRAFAQVLAWIRDLDPQAVAITENDFASVSEVHLALKVARSQARLGHAFFAGVPEQVGGLIAGMSQPTRVKLLNEMAGMKVPSGFFEAIVANLKSHGGPEVQADLAAVPWCQISAAQLPKND